MDANLHRRAVLAYALFVLVQASPASAISYQTVVANGNRVGVTLSNFGVIGNNFISRSASLEFPLGSGYEHLVKGGLWIGARATDGAGEFTGVTTGMLDASQASLTSDCTEFTPGAGILRRSRQFTSPYYSPAAVSDLDVLGSFDDATAKSTSWSPEAHRPLHVSVRHESYQWSGALQQDFAIQRFVIRNTGTHVLHDVHVGMFTELASGPKYAYGGWPPSPSSPNGSWYGKALLAWDGAPRLLREHQCIAQPIPDGCHFEVTPAWMGVQLLTAPSAGQQVTTAVWNYAPFDLARDQDVERYAILSAGTLADVEDPAYLPGTGDPLEMLALGPFPTLAAGDSIEVAFALVGGAEVADILASAQSAQNLHDAGYVDPLVDVAMLPAGAQWGLAPGANPFPQGGGIVFVDVPENPGSESRSVRLEVLNVAGRRIGDQDLSELGPGRHQVRLVGLASAPPGVYFLKLSDGRVEARSRVVLLP